VGIADGQDRSERVQVVVKVAAADPACRGKGNRKKGGRGRAGPCKKVIGCALGYSESADIDIIFLYLIYIISYIYIYMYAR
jgi:hypothetical protein